MVKPCDATSPIVAAAPAGAGHLPHDAYQVSGEYAMIEAAALNRRWIKYTTALC